MVAFDLGRIERAVLKAFEVSNEGRETESRIVAEGVFKDLLSVKAELVKQNKKAVFLPTVEMIQDMAEKELMKNGYTETAKKYILYRSRRSELRAEFGPVPEITRKP